MTAGISDSLRLGLTWVDNSGTNIILLKSVTFAHSVSTPWPGASSHFSVQCYLYTT